MTVEPFFLLQHFREAAGALQEPQSVVVAPAADVFFADEIHGTDEFHSLEIRAPEFGQHSLILAGVEHAHEDGLDGVVKVVAQGDLVAAMLLREAVEIAAAHAGAEIAGGFFDSGNGVKDIGAAEFDRDSQEPGIGLDQ